MTDRELLEAAARAYGFTHEGWVDDYDDGRGGTGPGLINWSPERGVFVWNPLTDDGDAFRLMVSLRLDAAFKAFGEDEVMVADSNDRFPGWFSEPYEGNPAAATRRAIVRAAAALDKTGG